ncbi:TetR/AcrR family transcriptional regulator [Pseudonocardia nigra]|uniref:TetR/AcrR family transcriptional regulator n=1 Tax=Pseudonocardia nigra TaxID=1921578 RepID=UPI001C606944|nr:TetR/AcrR family transcriptional regulator [Pseudonocardia nigra]
MSQPQDRRAVILSKSAELFARKGVSATTVREIADEVGMLSGSLYHHFPSKDAILYQIITSYVDDLLARYREAAGADLDPRARMHALVLVSLQTAEARPHATQIYQNELSYLRERPQYEPVFAAVSQVQQAWLDTIEAGRAAGVFRQDIAPRIFYRFIRDAVWLSVRWRKPDSDYPVEQLADDCTSIFLDGFAVRTPAEASPST